MAELFALPFDVNPTWKHCCDECDPFAEVAEIDVHLDAFPFIWETSGYCHPEPSDAEDPLMSPRMRQYPD